MSHLEGVKLKVLDIDVVLHLPRPGEVSPCLVQLLAQDLDGQPLHDISVWSLEGLEHVETMFRQIFKLFPETPVARTVLGGDLSKRIASSVIDVLAAMKCKTYNRYSTW